MIRQTSRPGKRRITPGTKHLEHHAVGQIVENRAVPILTVSARLTARAVLIAGRLARKCQQDETVNCDGGVLTDDVHPGADEILFTHASIQPLNPRHLFHRRRCSVLGRTGLCGRCADRAWIRDRKDRCGRCHAVGKTGESTNPKSPPFRYLSRRYPLADLEEALAEGIIVGHEGVEMPHFQFSQPMIAALTAYMDAVQAR